MTDRALLDGMRAAVEADPQNVALRLHYAELLAGAGQADESVRQAAAVLQIDPSNPVALELITGPRSTPNPARQTAGADADSDEGAADDGAGEPSVEDTLAALEQQLEGTMPPRFESDDGDGSGDRVRAEQDAQALANFDVESAGLRLSDVGGMERVKERLQAAILAPLRNPELKRLYGKSIGGGLLLYGPPGCGKTFVARALAGEIGARFIAVSLADVLDMYVGQSERNVHELFELARRNSPCVVFLDEVDALGHKRSQMRNSAARGAVNQLLTEMDGASDTNEGVFVLGATNHPWDVDVALRRPGRFDRMLLVLPPDDPARATILELHLRNKPIERIKVDKLVKATAGFSGADLRHLVDAAAERALIDSARTGTARMIAMADFEAALADVKPSVGPWFETARNVAEFGNSDGSYDELLAYLRGAQALMSVPPPGEVVALQRIAALVEMQRWDDAIGAARSLLAAEPENWKALCLLSQSLSAQNDFTAGLEAARAAITLNPESDWPHRLASIAQRCLGNGGQAISHANEAVRLSPQLSESYRVLTQALLFTGDLHGAARASIQALNLRPNDPANHRLIGIVAFQRDELDASEAAFRRALALEPDDAVSHNELARISLRRSQQLPGGLARSAQGFARALAADPRQTGSRNNLELVLRIFLARGAYFLFIAAWLTAICEANYASFSRVLGIVLLIVPIGFALRFIYSLTPQLRAVLLATISDDPVLTGAVGCELVTVGLLAGGGIADKPGLSIGAVVAAILARVLVYSRLSRSSVRDRIRQRRRR